MAFGLPKTGEIIAQLNEKFDRLISEIQLVQQAVRENTAELRTQRGGGAA